MRVTDEVENQPQPTGQPRKVSFPSAQSRAERDATTPPQKNEQTTAHDL